MGSGAVLGLAPAPEYTFIIFVSPVGNYFKVCIEFFFSFQTPLNSAAVIQNIKTWT
jgi:branched-subunit amino acid aminotransferase/4-amino-4-deoxychorismate lyase